MEKSNWPTAAALDCVYSATLHSRAGLSLASAVCFSFVEMKCDPQHPADDHLRKLTVSCGFQIKLRALVLGHLHIMAHHSMGF